MSRLVKLNENRIDLLIRYISSYKIGVEIGVYKGYFSKDILSRWNGTLYLIDAWRALGNEYQDISNTEDDTYKDTINNIKKFDKENRAIMIRSLSSEAVHLFKDESLDFVYIDANHAYDFVKQDLELWWPKIKKGGCLSGHDYIDINWYEDPHFVENKKDKHIWSDKYVGLFGVNPAVDEFCEKYDLTGHLSNEWFGSYYINKK